MAAEMIRLALGRLRANLLRSLLTILGIVIGIAAVVSVVSLGTAVRSSIDQQFAGLGADTVTVQPGYATAGPSDAAVPGLGIGGGGVGQRLVGPVDTAGTTPLTDQDLATITAIPSVATAAPVVRERLDVTAGSGEQVQTSLIATTAELAAIEAFDLAAGSFLTDLAADRGLPVAVVGADAAADLGLEADAVGDTVALDGRTFAVVGILTEQGGLSFVNPDDAVIVPLAVAEGSLIGRDPDLDQIRVAAGPGDVGRLADDVTEALRAGRDLDVDDDADFTVVEATSIIAVADQTSSTLTGLISAVGAISLVVGAIGIANMMLVAVRERTREIGIRRAVGATRADVTVQFLSESVVLSLLGGAIGTAGGVALSQVLATGWLGVDAELSTVAIALALGVSAVVGVVAGIGPAWQAASVDPTTALRYE